MEWVCCCGLPVLFIFVFAVADKWVLSFFGILFGSKDLIHEAGNLCEKEIPYKDQFWNADDVPELRAAREERRKRQAEQPKWKEGDTLFPERFKWPGTP